MILAVCSILLFQILLGERNGIVNSILTKN